MNSFNFFINKALQTQNRKYLILDDQEMLSC
jgi:hypothetical protein